MNEEEQELPPEMDEGTPVVWPTDPEDDSDSETIKQEVDDDGYPDVGESTESENSKTYSYWFGSEVAAEDDDRVEEEEDEGLLEQKEKPSTSRKRRQKQDSEDDDPDWTEENDGVILPKKRTRAQRKSDVQNYSETTGVSQTGDGNSKQSSRFRFSWTEDFRWLHYDAKFKLMFCRLCQQAGKSGDFVRGSGDFSKVALRIHDISKEHIAAECAVKRLTTDGGGVYDDNEMAPEPTPGIDDDDDDGDTQNTLYSDAALLVALRTAYHTAQHAGERNPVHVYNSMMALQDSCNVLGAKELRLGKQPEQTSVLHVEDTPVSEVTEYAFGDDESLAEMHDVLARILQEDLFSKISHSDFIAIIIQERPDADLQPLQMQLIIHARYRHKEKVCVGFLATIMVSKDKPEQTVSEVMRVLEECEIPVWKVRAIHLQCPRKNGKAVTVSDIHHWQIAKGFVDLGNMIVLVSAQKHPPWNTCLSLAAQKLEEGTKYQHLLGRLVIYLQSISTKLQAIEPLKELVNDPLCQWDGLQMPAWMMVQKMAKVVCSIWPTLIEVLETEATSQGDTQAQLFLDELQKYQFLAFVHLIPDILPIMKDLEIQLNYKTPDGAYQHTRDALNKLVTEHQGENEERFSKGLDLEKKTFCNRHIYFSELQRDRADEMRTNFIQNVGKEIQARCAVLERIALRGAFRILNPKVLASMKETELGEFGRTELQTLTSAFLDVASDKDYFPEYQEMKMMLFTHHKGDSLKTVSEKICAGKSHQQAPSTSSGVERCPNIVKLLRCSVVIPGVCMKTDQDVGKTLKQSQEFMEKYGTEATTLSRMMIVNHGVKLNTFDFVSALQEWNSV